MSDSGKPQLLHLVLVGELVDFEHATFKDLEKVETVGILPNYASAHAAWKAKAQQTVDNAHMRDSSSISIDCLIRAKMPTRCGRPRDVELWSDKCPNLE